MADTLFPLPRETRESGINVGDGTAGPYGPSAYSIFDTADVTVWRKEPADKFFRDVTASSIVTKTAGAELDTFSVTFASAVAPTTKWYHSAKRISNRQVAVTRAGALDAPQLEKELSKQASALSEIRRDLGRALRVDPGNVAPSVEPAPDGYFSIWQDGNLIPGGTATDIANAEANAALTRLDRIAAEAARDAALAAMSSVVPNMFPSVAAAALYAPVTAPLFAYTAGFAVPGDSGGARYKKAPSQPAHAAKFSRTLADGVTVVWYEIDVPELDPCMLGTPTGGTDATSALAVADAVALALGIGLIWTRTHRAASNLTISSPVRFAKGGKLALDADVRVGFEGGIHATGDYQIFQYANRTSRAYVRNAVVRGYWWGMDGAVVSGAFRKLNNEIPLQYALDSVAGYNFGNDPLYTYSWQGGTIELPSGYYSMQAGVTMHGFTTLRGASRSCIFRPDNAGGWTGTTDYLFKMFRELTATATISIASPAIVSSTAHGLALNDRVFFTTTGTLPTGIVANTEYFVVSPTTNQFQLSATSGGAPISTTGTQSGVHTWHKGVSQFNVRLENCRIMGQGFAGVVHQVLSWSGQEQCGCYNVHFDSVAKYGLTYQRGYGGAAVFELSQCELWFAATSSVVANLINVNLTSAFLVGHMNLLLSHITCAAASSFGSEERAGVYISGRVLAEVKGLHFESTQYGVFLEDYASMQGGPLTGGPGNIDVIALSPTWQRGEAFVDVHARKGNSTRLLRDMANPTRTSWYNDQIRGRVQYPPDPNMAIGWLDVQNGTVATPTASYLEGNLSSAITKPGTGRYGFTMPSTMGSAANYRVRVDFEFGPNQAVSSQVARNSGTDFEVRFRDGTGTPVDVASFRICLQHVP